MPLTIDQRKAAVAFFVSFVIALFDVVSLWLQVWPIAFGLLLGNGNCHDIGDELVRGIKFGFLGWLVSAALQVAYFQFWK